MPVKFKSEVSLDALGNATIDTDKFLVSDSGIVKYRTGTQLAVDLGVPTKTSDLINDGDDGNPFISLEDLPSNLTLYATNAASDVATYYKLVTSITDPSFNTTAVNIPTGEITTTNQFISSLITTANVITGNPGVFNITTIGNIQRLSGTGNAEFYFEVWKRVAAGTETLITTSNNTLPVLNSGYAEFSATALWNDGVFLSTDRIVLKYYASRVAGGSNPSYQFQFGGISPIRSLVPIPLNVVPVIKLDDLQDVTITSVANNEILTYETASNLWKNKTVVSALGFTPYNATNPNGYTSNVGTVYSVYALELGTLGTDLYSTVTSASTTPLITLNVPTSSATNRGALSAADWIIFNGKQNALNGTGFVKISGTTISYDNSTYQPLLTNPITGTGTTNYLPKFTGASALGNSKLYEAFGTILNDATANFWAYQINGSATIGQSLGAVIVAGTNSSDISFAVRNQAGSIDYLKVRGDGNVGIGTTSPSTKLSVAGDVGLRASALGSAATQILVTSADPTSTTRTVQTRTPVQLLSDIGAQPLLTNPITGTGTTNYLPKFTGASALGNSVLQEVSGNFTANNPNFQYFRIRETTTGNLNTAMLQVDGTYAKFIADYSTTAIPMAFRVGDVDRVVILPSGNVGIGTTSPQAKLHSNSDILTGYFQNGTNGIYDALKITNNTASNNLSGNSARIQFYNNANNSTNLLGASIRSVNVDYGWASDLILSSVQNNGYASQTVNDAIYIKSNGNVGIGTTSPTDFGGGYTNLDVFGTNAMVISRNSSGLFGQMNAAGNDALYLGTRSNHNVNLTANNSNVMTLTAGGNVGIGTTSPVSKFHVEGSSYYANDLFTKNGGGIFFSGNGLFTSGIFQNTNGLNLQANGSPRLTINSSGNVGIGTTAPSFPLSLGMGLGNKIGLYDAASGTGYGFGIQANLLQMFSNQLSDDISFGYGNSTAFTRNVTFKGTGNVGIGTTSPTAIGTNITTLDIKGSSGGGVRSGVAGGSESTFYTIAAGGYLGTISNIPLNFQTNNSVKATILASGNVGIGTTSPTSKLHVVGLVDYATNALAIAAGLTKGAFYHTGGVVKVVI